MYIKRAISDEIKEYIKSFPVLLISGARQVGKSTLALNLDISNIFLCYNINYSNFINVGLQNLKFFEVGYGYN